MGRIVELGESRTLDNGEPARLCPLDGDITSVVYRQRCEEVQASVNVPFCGEGEIKGAATHP